MSRLPPAVSRRARVEQVKPFFCRIDRNMRMTEHHDVRLGKPSPQTRRPALRGATVMDNGDVDTFPVVLEALGQREAEIVVAHYRVHRGDRFELLENVERHKVPGVDDGIDARQKLVRFCGQVFRPPRDMCVRQNTDEHVQIEDMSAEVNIGLLGLGTVGAAVAETLTVRRQRVEDEIGLPVRLSKVLVRNLDKRRDFAIDPALITTNPDDILDDPNINMIVEVMGGEEPAGSYIERAFKAGKHVVTANKELVAKRGRELLALAAKTNVDFHYEASVGGGIPLIGPFKQDLVANRILKVKAIINGTTNYILTRMAEDGAEFGEALAEAQDLGYAEKPDPSNDVEGIDASYKLAILSTLAFHIAVRPDQIYRQGITKLTARDFRYASDLGYTIKLLAIASDTDGDIEVRVHPALLERHALLARVDGVYNAVEVEGDMVGKVMFTGRGAGAAPTASAVIADIIDIAQDTQREFGFITPVIRFDDSKRIKLMGDVRTRYYLRLEVADEPGVLSQITKVLGEQHISIASIIQKEVNDQARSAELVIVTHQALERSVTTALDLLQKLPIVHEVGCLIRIEEDE